MIKFSYMSSLPGLVLAFSSFCFAKSQVVCGNHASGLVTGEKGNAIL